MPAHPISTNQCIFNSVVGLVRSRGCDNRSGGDIYAPGHGGREEETPKQQDYEAIERYISSEEDCTILGQGIELASIGV